MRLNLSPNPAFESLEARSLLSSYFVSTTGSDNAAGTQAAPWKTLQKAANSVAAGDTVNVGAGDYAGFSAFSLKGTSANHITFQAQGAVNIVSRATAQSAVDVGIELSGYDAASGSAYVDVIGFNVNNASNTIVGGVSSGFRIRYSNNIRLINCKATNCGWVGFYNAYSKNITIENCESAFNNKYVDGSTQRNHGIYVANSSSGFIIRNTIIHDNNGNGLHSNGDGGVISGCTYEGNIIYNNGANGGSAINCDGIQNSIIRNNLLYNNKNKGIAFYSIDATGGSSGNTVVNNTVVMSSSSGNAAMQIKDNSTNNKVFNNIFIHQNANSPAIDFYNEAMSGTQIDYNVYAGKMSGDGAYQTFAQWRSNYSSFDAHSFTSTASAVFVSYAGNDYHLSATSPAIDKGTSTSAPTVDQDLGARPAGAGYDIGAYEYGAGGGGGTITAPAAPTALAATAMAFNQINLSWTDNSDNESGFKIERRLGLDGTWGALTTVGAGTNTYVDNTASGNSTYYYRVCATNSAGDSAYSNTDSALTPVAPALPNAPSAVAATAYAYNNIGVVWTDNSSDETGFKIERRLGTTGTFAQVASVSANVTSWTDTTVTGDSTYYYRIRSTNAAGDSAYSNMDSALTPATPSAPASPTNLALAAPSPTQVNLTWSDNSTNETGFRIDRKVGTGSFAFLANVAAGVTSYSDTSVAGATAYSYRVRAYNDVGTSAWSNNPSVTTPAAATTPAAPTGLGATAAGTSQVNLAWTDASSNETGFKIEQKIGTGTFLEIATVAAGVTSYNVTSLTASTQYSYRVRATNAQGDSPYSNTATATTAALPTVPAAPSNLSATAGGTTQVNLAWTDASNNETGFKIEQQIGADAWVEIATVNADVTSYSATELSASTQYNYRVRATNAVGDSAYSNTATATTAALPTAPVAPTNLGAEALSHTQVKLTWTDASNNETGFRIERDDNGTFVQVGTVGAGVTTWTDSSLTPETEYTYRVIATNAVGDSPASIEASATTQVAPTAPAAPSDLATTVASWSQINLSWTDNSANETGFKILRSLDGTTWTQVGTVAAGVTTFQASGLLPATLYHLAVVATNAVGDSAMSTEATATTDVQGDTTVPTATGTFSNITAAGDGTYTFTVTYTDDTAIDATTIDNTNVRVTAPNGFNQLAELISIGGAGATRTATYRIHAPGNTWTWQDDGDYTVALVAGEVADSAGNTAAAKTLGTINLLVPSVDYAGDTKSTARQLGVYSLDKIGVYNDVVETLDIQDWYKIKINSTMLLTAKIYNLIDDANLQLRALDGTLIQASGRAGTNYDYISRVLKPGTYYFRVLDNAMIGTGYNMRITTAVPPVGGAQPTLPDYAGNTLGTARNTGSFTAGRASVYTDLVNALDTQDYYKFTTSGTVAFSAKLTGLTGDVNMELLDAAGHVLQVSGREGTNYELITRTLSAGTYFIRLYTVGAGSETTLRLAAA